MAKLKYYVLTNKNLIALKRHCSPNWSNIPKKDLFVIINTQNEDFSAKAEQYLNEEGIEYCVTESDGTPSTGKNSFLDKFLESNDEYAVLIDGDDWLTPHGVWVYNYIANLEEVPDVVCLKNQFSLWPKTVVDDWETDSNTIPCKGVRFFQQDNWQTALTGQYIVNARKNGIKSKFFKNKAQAYIMYPKKMENLHAEWSRINYYYIDNSETHSRVVFMSKKAAGFKFDGEHKVGEDTIQYLELKDAAIRGELNMVSLDESIPTYVYDQRVSGVAVGSTWEKSGKGFMGWLQPLVEKYLFMESCGLLHTEELPEIEIDYPIGYIPNVFELVDWREYIY